MLYAAREAASRVAINCRIPLLALFQWGVVQQMMQDADSSQVSLPSRLHKVHPIGIFSKSICTVPGSCFGGIHSYIFFAALLYGHDSHPTYHGRLCRFLVHVMDDMGLVHELTTWSYMWQASTRLHHL